MGKVTTSFDGVAPSEKLDWTTLWDKEKKVVRSVTGELAWDYGRRIVTLAAPKTQAVVGFAGGTSHDLPGVKVDVETSFVSLIFTPLDDLPLAASKHILITAMARDRQAGTEYSEDGTKLLKAGGPPLSMEPVRATIALKGAAPAPRWRSARRTGRRPSLPAARGGTFTIDGRWRAYYYEVRR